MRQIVDPRLANVCAFGVCFFVSKEKCLYCIPSLNQSHNEHNLPPRYAGQALPVENGAQSQTRQPTFPREAH
jgi:hypothetical protein